MSIAVRSAASVGRAGRNVTDDGPVAGSGRSQAWARGRVGANQVI
ncbi:MAG: hypothetical protein ACXV3V_08870 [Actinomycetes bacterium]